MGNSSSNPAHAINVSVSESEETKPPTTAYFLWRCAGDTTLQEGDTLPAPTEPVVELILNRNSARLAADGVRPHLGHPVHEAAMRAELPASLQILRIDGCRIRTWPTRLPLGLLEFYARGCDFFTLPDLSAYTSLIVIEMPDNRIERLTQPLPPNLVRLSLTSNCLYTVTIPKPDSLVNIGLYHNRSLLEILQNERSIYTARCRDIRQAAMRALGPAFREDAVEYPAPPQSALPTWVINEVAPQYFTEWMRPPARLAAPAPTIRPKNAYENSQNVHDPGIQGSTRSNLNYIAGYRPEVPPNPRLLEEIEAEPLLRSGDIVITSLRERLAIPYSMHGHTIREIVDRLWLRICDFPDTVRPEVLRRFREEVLEAHKFCMNGFMVRMANVLVGFDENIVMQLRPTQIIQARIPATMKRLRDALDSPAGEEPWTYWRDCTVQTWTDMEEVDMDVAEREVWLTPLIEPMLDFLCTEPRAIKADEVAIGEAMNAALTARNMEEMERLRVEKTKARERRDEAIAEAIDEAGLHKPPAKGSKDLGAFVYDAMIAVL